MRLFAGLSAAALALTLGACAESTTAPTPLTEVAEAKPGFAAAAKPSGSTIVALAEATPALATLVTVIGLSDADCGTSFGATLSGKRGQFTVFAPTNDAFTPVLDLLGNLPAGLTFCDVVPTVLAYHVTRGRHHSQSVLSNDSFRMLSGEFAEVDAGASPATVGGAPLNLGLLDISASNGIVHVVDAVLLPPSILAALN